ncbi:MAG: histidine kinase [Bacteroidetes bacterium]|nr:histidine kinase [Bacteroidota bacterium]
MGRYLLIIPFVFTALVSGAQKIKGLVAKYSFNKGNANDDLGLNNAKTYGVSLAEDRFGNVDKAYYFHGSSESYLDLGTSEFLKPEKGTISVWVNVHALIALGRGVDTNPIITTNAHDGEDCNQSYFIGFDINTRKINGSTANSCEDASTVYTRKKISLGHWHHVVLTYDDTTLSLYLDGKLQYKIKKKFKTCFLKESPIIIGNIRERKNMRFFLGCIDDIHIYNRTLTEAEINELYKAPDPEENKIFLKWMGLGLMFLGVILGIIFLVKRRIRILVNREKDKNQLRNNWYEQENKVLTAQMDPHFIFNSLNTIQQFIIINDNEKAQLYLSKFSRLLRMILESNLKDTIGLKEEIEIVEKYLEIESLRFNNVFKYKISLSEKINLHSINIPRFLIQPFIENAIWHGLLPKQGDKQLNIFIQVVDDKTLSCIIEDNGIGRENARKRETPEKDKSLAINFIGQRLQLMSEIYKSNYNVVLADKSDENGESLGTIVTITIPILNN